MKLQKLLIIPIIVLTLVAAFVLAACNTFVNPGDELGGGRVGEIATAVDDTASKRVKSEIQAKSDLSALASDVSEDGATKIPSTSAVVEISENGTYLFEGEYGGIKTAKKDLKLHFIFKNASFTRSDGVAIDCQDKKVASLVITLVEGTVNTVENGGDDANAVHVKGGALKINGKGVLNVTSDSKSALKCGKQIEIVDATLNLKAANHAITGSAVTAQNCVISATAGKDGINAECDDYTEQERFTDDGFVCLSNVAYTCRVLGDGIQANTVVYVSGGTYDVKTTGNFVQKTNANMLEFGMTNDDFKYIKSGDDYKRIASDEMRRYSSGQLYGLSQGCKGIKVSEIEYEDDDGKTVTVTDADYLIVIVGGAFTIDSTDDAIHTNCGNLIIEGGTFDLTTYDDAITSDVLTKITGGNVTVKSSYEGIEGAYVEISDGTINVKSSDDGINAASDDRKITPHIIISGGCVTVDASGDGIDSNGSILISGGVVVVHGPTTGGDAGLDADKGIVVTGGTLFVTSTLGMVETPASNSTQYVVSYAHQSTITAGSTVALKDKKGNVLVSVEVLKNCQSVIISSPNIKKGGTYYIYGNDKKMTSFTVSSIITTIGSSGNSFPGGDRPAGPGGPGGPGGR